MGKKIFLTLSLLASFFMQAQEPVSVHLSEKDGLPDKEFYNIIEDSKGFIWLCADKGLFSYNGKTFKNYTNSEKRGLSVFGLKEDEVGRIWANNITGQFFYVENDTLHTFIDLSKKLKGELSTFEIRDNSLFVLTAENVFSIDLSTKKITNTINKTNTLGGFLKTDETILIASQDAIIEIDKQNKFNRVLETKLIPLKNGKSIVSGRPSIFKLNKYLFYRQIWNKKQAFFKFDIEKQTFFKIDNFNEVSTTGRVYSTYENNNEIWFTTSDGVWVYELVNNTFILKKQFLKGKNVTKVIQDKDQNYWFITLNNGVYVMPNINVEQLVVSPENKNISSIDKVNTNTLLFGTNNGQIALYNTQTNTEQSLLKIPKTTRVSSVKYNPKLHKSYVGFDADGLVLDHNTFKTKLSHSSYSVKNFSLLNDNTVLYINYKNVGLLKKGDEYKTTKTNKIISNNRRPYTSYFSKKNKSVYIGFVDNLVVYDSLWNTKTITYKTKPIYVLSITETDNGILWFATFKNGVFGVKNNKIVSHLSIEKGLVSNRIEKIKADKNKLWIASDSGIQQYNINTNSFKTLTKRDGILSYNISGIEIMGDKVVFSSKDGLFAIDKTKAFKTQIPPKVYFSRIEINETETEIKSKYELDYNKNTIKIGFNVNGFQFNQKGKYSYRLLGFNENWITTETNVNHVEYNSLPAGDYTFQVKPMLDIDALESDIKAFKISIKKPFWETWWFILVVSILVFGLLNLYFKNKIKSKEIARNKEIKQLSIDNELIALKLENLRSQMNPHFIFNALNSIQEYIVLNQRKLASEYLGKFADLIRAYLNHSTKGNITLQEEINCLEMYLELEKLRFEDKLKYHISISNDLIPDDISIPTMLIQPYVENALKHGLLHRKDNRNLQVSFSLNQNSKTITCNIVDNGVGREKAAEFKARKNKNHVSFATKATENRLDLLNYGKEKQVGVTITDLFENEEPTGTQVTIIIPFTTD